MYLSELKLWNFRKYGIQADSIEIDNPAVIVELNPKLNVLIGENDSGKTAIVDAIRYILGTQSREWLRLDESDFYGVGPSRSQKMKIECVFRGFSTKEAAPFLEWMGFEEIDKQQEYILSVRLNAERKSNRIITYFRAGPDPIGLLMDGEARDLLRITYLKPLRDADAELTPGRRSRLAQILSAHKLLQKAVTNGEKASHYLEEIFAKANEEIETYFSINDDAEGQGIMKALDGYLTEFFPENNKPKALINISGGGLADILRRLRLALGDNSEGLGSLNLLYIATELLLLQSNDFNSLRLGIIEELEAHLHPQAQLRLIHFLKKESDKVQFILTTHSTTLGASIDLESLIICKGSQVFPMGSKHTTLEPQNYSFLQRFLDATKANLFFARGVILVEGDTENLLLPTIAKIIGRPLHRYGVSIVNVGSTAFLHYAKIFQRKDGNSLGIKVALVTDMDVKPVEWVDKEEKTLLTKDVVEQKKKRVDFLEQYNVGDTKVFVSPNWTLEYEIALSAYHKLFYQSILWAQKIENAKTGIPKESKLAEVKDNLDEDFDRWKNDWEEDDRKREKIAYEIYRKTMLNKNVSKTITAQKFAEMISDRAKKNHVKFKNKLIDSEYLKYIIDAIFHVTAPLKLEGSDD